MQYNFYVLVSTRDLENIRYVGVTTRSLGSRMSGHRYNAKHKNKRICPVSKWIYHEYKNNCDVKIKLIDTCGEDVWEERERYWINFYRNKGYKLLNVDPGGRGVITKDKRASGIDRSIKAHEKEIYALDDNLNIVYKFDSATKAAKFFGIKARTAITNAINGKWTPKSCGYHWVYASDYKNNTYKIINKPKPWEKYCKKLYRFDLNGNFIKEYESLRDFCRTEKGHNNTQAIKKAIQNKTEHLNSLWSFDRNTVFNYKKHYNYYEIDINNNIVDKFMTLVEITKKYGRQDSYWSTFIKNSKTTNNNTKIIKNINKI